MDYIVQEASIRHLFFPSQVIEKVDEGYRLPPPKVSLIAFRLEFNFLSRMMLKISRSLLLWMNNYEFHNRQSVTSASNGNKIQNDVLSEGLRQIVLAISLETWKIFCFFRYSHIISEIPAVIKRINYKRIASQYINCNPINIFQVLRAFCFFSMSWVWIVMIFDCWLWIELSHFLVLGSSRIEGC